MIIFVQKLYHKHFRILNLSNLREINPFILIAVILIGLTSCLLLYSAAGSNILPWAGKQFMHFVLSLFVMAVVVSIQPDIIAKMSYIIYSLSIFLLIAVRFVGHNAMGAQRWIDLKIFHLQPSEVVKFGIILILAQYFEKISGRFNNSILGVVPPILILAPVFILVASQPDLATSIIIVALTATMMFASGTSIKAFITCGMGFVLSAPLLWTKLHDYQKKRIINFINPDSDPFGSGYNIIQSKIAIGSGGIIGKGFAKGWQSQLNFLPENQTDFIFAVLAEDFGFAGCIIIMLLYATIICYGIVTSLQAKTIFLKMTSFGATCFLFLHVVINAGMTTGILPAAGVPMPMMSYGGTSFLITMSCIGLIFNAAIYSNHQS